MTTSDDLREAIFPGNTTAFSDLVSFMEKEKVIAFTGAGVSVPICPSWFGLLTELLDEARQRGFINDPQFSEYQTFKESEPLELATLLEEAFTKKAFRSRLADIFRNPNGEFTSCHKIISELKLKGIATLNYDNGHEVALSKRGVYANVGRPSDAILSRWIDGKIFEDGAPPILHLHGDVSDPDKMTITADDYNSFYSELLPESTIQHIWRSSQLLVIGFGFSDPFLTRAVEKVLRNFDSGLLHFAFIGRGANESISPTQRRMFAKKYRLSPIFYEIKESKEMDGKSIEDHSALARLLDILPKTADPVGDTVAQPQPAPAVEISTGVARKTVDDEALREFQRDLFVLPKLS